VLVNTLVRLYFGGRFAFDRVLTSYSFSEINKAAHDAATGAVVKPVLLMD
jgi:aryl-alcohol dehydrogenase